MLWNKFHLEPHIVLGNIKFVRDTACGLRFQVDQLFKNLEKEKLGLAATA